MQATERRIAGPGGHAVPERTCIVTRAPGDPASLIRFALGPDDQVVPDVAGKLPGRGAWVSAHHEIVAEAVKKRAFQRAFRKPVTASPDLADQVDQLLRRRAIQALSFANKAGLAIAGFAKVDSLIEGGRAYVLIHAADASDGGADRLTRKFTAVSRERDVVPIVVRLFDIEDLGLALGRANVVHAALSPGRAADGFVAATERLAHYRQPPQVIPEDASTTSSGAPSRARQRNAGPETEEV